MGSFVSRKNFCHKCGGKLSEKKNGAVMRKYCTPCGSFFYDNPLPAVAVVVMRQDSVLLVKRGVAPARGFWALPGGFMEGAESPEKAALRELREETGLKGKSAEVIGVFTENTVIFGGIMVIGVEVKGATGVIAAGDDAAEAFFFERGRLPFVPFRSHRKLVSKKMKDKTAEA